MPRKMPMFYSALLLTGVNLLLRLAGTSFQVYLSGKIGAAGIGLLQLVMSVGSLAMIAGMAGIRTATMYLTAEELGRKQNRNIIWVLSGCARYSVICSGIVAAVLYIFAPQIAENWIADTRTVQALRLFSGFLPVTCLCGVMTGYFTASQKIGLLAMIEIAEQLISMVITIGFLHFWAGTNTVKACQCVILGSGIGSILSLLFLVVFRVREPENRGMKIPLKDRIIHAALPLAAADILKSGINTVENLMVPNRLSMNVTIENSLAAFGVVSGMVFPVLMFPACVLYGLAELLIPELARCNAAGSRKRVSYLVQKTLKTAMLYGLFFSGFLFLLAKPLCIKLYNNVGAGEILKLYALLVPMLYCDAVTDAMTKGLGQQKICVRYNILTSALDVVFLYLLLPVYGMEGYYVSFAVTHFINFLLSLRRLLKISRVSIPVHMPILSVTAGMIALYGASYLTDPGAAMVSFIAVMVCLLVLFQIISWEDVRWITGLLISRKNYEQKNRG